MSEPDGARDEPRDPHLREALRHAPDTHVQAPAALGDFILKEARAKARDPGATAAHAAPGRARRVWDWLARPAVATGFAGVMAATLVGLMWWDQPMDEAQPRSPVPAAAPAIEPPAPQPPVDPPAEAARELRAETAKPEGPRKKADATRSSAPGATTRQASAPVQSPPAEAEAKGAAADLAREAAGGAPATSAEARRPAPPVAQAPMAAQAPAAAAPALSADMAEAPSRRAAAKAQLNESRLQREAEAYTRIASVRAAIAAEPARWTWQRGTRPAQPVTDAVSAWLSQLDTAAGNRWQIDQARSAAPGRGLVLLRDGQVQHQLHLTERGVTWQRGPTPWQIELPADTLATLQAALDAATP
jgi:hypothetical protein